MIEMRRPRDNEVTALGELAKQIQQRDGIPASRQRDDDAAAGRKKVEAADGEADRITNH